MYQVQYTGQFKKSLKICQKRGLNLDLVSKAVDILRVDGSLPPEYKSHKLISCKGNRTWECHLQPDWLLVWEQNDDELILLMLNTGTHSDIF